eukprot:1280-Heterocapsa_arctica.AAC.1
MEPTDVPDTLATSGRVGFPLALAGALSGGSGAAWGCQSLSSLGSFAFLSLGKPFAVNSWGTFNNAEVASTNGLLTRFT